MRLTSEEVVYTFQIVCNSLCIWQWCTITFLKWIVDFSSPTQLSKNKQQQTYNILQQKHWVLSLYLNWCFVEPSMENPCLGAVKRIHYPLRDITNGRLRNFDSAWIKIINTNVDFCHCHCHWNSHTQGFLSFQGEIHSDSKPPLIGPRLG